MFQMVIRNVFNWFVVVCRDLVVVCGIAVESCYSVVIMGPHSNPVKYGQTQTKQSYSEFIASVSTILTIKSVV